jgi:hypothetical protein
MTLQELEQFLQGNYGDYRDYYDQFTNAQGGLLDGTTLSIDDIRMSQDLAHVPGSGSGGERLTQAERDARNKAWSTVQNSGQPLYTVIDGQRVYMNTGFGYVDGDYVINPDPNAPIGSYTVAGQKRGDGLTDVMLPLVSSIVGGPLAGLLTGASNPESGGAPGFGDLMNFYDYNTSQPDGYSQTFASDQENPHRPQPEPYGIEKVLESIEGLLGGVDPGAIKIPIPGLPFPIPGGLTWEQLMDMAKRAGKTVWEVLSDIGGTDEGGTTGGTTGSPPGGTTTTPPIVEEDPGNWWDFGWDWWGKDDKDEEEGGLVLGPGDGPGPSLPAPTPQDPFDGEQEENPLPGGTGGGNGGGTADGGGAALALPFLLPWLMQDKDKPRGPIDLWDYQGPDQSYGYETPDYGTPVDRPLFDWERQPNQPIQVAPDVQPRNPFLTPAEKAMLRQRQLEGLLG